MPYAVCEGVAFSLRQIAALIDEGASAPVRTSLDGPLAEPATRVKADAFRRPFAVVRQKACAALGAAMMAAVGLGRFPSLAEAAGAWVAVERVVEPRSDRAPLLDRRYGLYGSLYPALKESFARFARLRGEAR
jgi:xylulokinase